MATGHAVVADPKGPALLRRWMVRCFAAAMAAIVSVIYFLIGLRVVTVIQNPEEQVRFGLTAGIGFAIGAVLILLVDQRALWVAGAILVALIIFMYFNLAPERTPEFEVWGIMIRVAHVLLLTALGYLAVGHREQERDTTAPPARVGQAAP